jgi:hypothetical protein
VVVGTGVKATFAVDVIDLGVDVSVDGMFIFAMLVGVSVDAGAQETKKNMRMFITSIFVFIDSCHLYFSSYYPTGWLTHRRLYQNDMS